MVHSFLFAPFSDAARQEQYEAVYAALRADADAPVTLLLGNLAAADAPAGIDALIIQPGRSTLLLLVPEGGQLRIPMLEHGAWQLNEQPLSGPGDAANPFAFYLRQKTALPAWLGTQLDLAPTDLPALAGMVVFRAPVTYGPEVESQLGRQSAAHDFQLVREPHQLPRRLRQLAPPADYPRAADLTNWAIRLSEQLSATDTVVDETEYTPGFWEQKARQLWLWLGAADIPADPPYSQSPDPGQLEKLRRELQAELQQQQQAAEAREKARERELLQLRQQLTQVPDRNAASQQERAALEETLRVARNRELDARIQQLGQLMEQLRAQAVAPAAAKPKPPAPPVVRPVRPKSSSIPTSTRAAGPTKVRAERLVFVVCIVLGVGMGAWSVVRLASTHLTAPKPKREQPAVLTSTEYPAATNAEPAAATTADTTRAAAPPPDQDQPKEPVVVADPALIMQVPGDSAAKAAEQEVSPPADSLPH